MEASFWQERMSREAWLQRLAVVAMCTSAVVVWHIGPEATPAPLEPPFEVGSNSRPAGNIIRPMFVFVDNDGDPSTTQVPAYPGSSLSPQDFTPIAFHRPGEVWPVRCQELGRNIAHPTRAAGIWYRIIVPGQNQNQNQNQYVSLADGYLEPRWAAPTRCDFVKDK